MQQISGKKATHFRKKSTKFPGDIQQIRKRSNRLQENSLSFFLEKNLKKSGKIQHISGKNLNNQQQKTK